MPLAVVTGASSGIGAATAARLAREGWEVVGAARRDVDVPGVRAAVLDVTDPQSVMGFAASLASCDLLVANAGAALDLSPLAVADPQVWARMYDVNVLGTVRVVQALLPLLTAARGQVVMTGSTAGRWVYEGGGGYVAAKHALAALRDTLRLEVVGTGVRVSEVAPGMVKTEGFSLTRFDGDQAKADAVYEGVEALTAEDVADAIVWIATRPRHVNIDVVQLTPQQQAGVGKVDRR